MKLTRVWVPFELWEEINFNMWGEVLNQDAFLRRAVCFTGNHRLYGNYMQRVTLEWPNSCVNALTDYRINRKAWIGHAACALALQCPEDITRKAWGLLSNEQQVLANRQADRAIQSWEMRYRQSARIQQTMETPLLFKRNTRRSSQEGSRVRSSPIMESCGTSTAPK